MLRRLLGGALTAAAISVVCSACSPTLPPTTVPPPRTPTFEPFTIALKAYVEQTQPFRKQAAQEAEKIPGKAAPEPTAEQAVRTRQNTLADALRSRLRPNAKPGDIFGPPVASEIVRTIQTIFDSPKRDLIVDELAEQNQTPPNAPAPAINQRVEAPRLPPRLIELLPPLPKQLEYDFAGRTLILRDVDADVVVDYIPNALPVAPAAGPPAATAKPVLAGASSPLPMPQMRGSRIFAIMGD